jgi:hypothetical protein
VEPEQGYLAKRAEPSANLLGEQLRLLPCRVVPASVHFVEIDQVGIRALRPAPGSLKQLLREHSHRGRDRHALRIEEAKRVLVVETSRGDPRVPPPRQRDVVEHLIPRQLTDGLSVDEGVGDVQVALGVMVRDPGGQPGGRVGVSSRGLAGQVFRSLLGQLPSEHSGGLADFDHVAVGVTHVAADLSTAVDRRRDELGPF